MTRHYTLLLSLALLLLFSGCNSSMMPLREQGELTGKVYVIGNEPFTKLSLQLNDQDHVVLLCPPEINTYLHDHQGQQVRVTYNGTSKVPEGQAVRVTLAEVVKE